VIRNFILIGLFLNACMYANAQKAKPSFIIKTELTTPVEDGDFGYGLSLKYLVPLNKQTGVSFSIGSTRLDETGKLLAKKNFTRVRFLQLGYQYSYQSFYIEPKIGIGELGGRVYLDNSFTTNAEPSVAAVLTGIEIGYNIKQFQVGFNFSQVNGIEKEDAGLWYNRSLSYASVFVALKIKNR
jgi:hypothetical protein